MMSQASNTITVAYGTMMDRESLGLAVGATRAACMEIKPVLVRGYRRVFNVVGSRYRPSHLLSEEPIEVGAANVQRDPGSYFNAMALWVTSEELAILDGREASYARDSVDLEDFETGLPMSYGLIYVATPKSGRMMHDPKQLLPRWRDICVARAACYGWSKRFGEIYDQTSYLADGITLVADRYPPEIVPRESCPPPDE